MSLTLSAELSCLVDEIGGGKSYYSDAPDKNERY
jgi:hypothetical protein